jgi:hypothetical protein
MSSYSLDDIRAAADAKYGATEIVVDADTTVRLINPLRLAKADRDALLSVQDRLTDESEDVDQADVFAQAIRTVADNKSAADKLIEAIGGDLAILAEVFRAYTEGASVGEASASAN